MDCFAYGVGERFAAVKAVEAECDEMLDVFLAVLVEPEAAFLVD